MTIKFIGCTNHIRSFGDYYWIESNYSFNNGDGTDRIYAIQATIPHRVDLRDTKSFPNTIKAREFINDFLKNI